MNMPSLLPDLSQIQSPCSLEIPKAINQFERMIKSGEIDHEQSIALAVELSHQIFNATVNRQTTFEVLLKDHQNETPGVTQFYPYFATYACVYEHNGQKDMVEQLFRLYAPFSTYGIVRPHAMRQMDKATTGHLAQLLMLLNKDGSIQVRPVHLIGLFGQQTFLNSIRAQLWNEPHIDELFTALEGVEVEDRIAVESLVHNDRIGLDDPDMRWIIEHIERRMLPESRICSRLMTCLKLLVAPIDGASLARSMANAIEEVPEHNRKHVLNQILRSVGSIFETRTLAPYIPVATRNFAHLFQYLEPLGFNPFDSMGALGVFDTLTPDDIITTTVERCQALEGPDVKTFKLSWLQGALSAIDVEKFLARQPPVELASYLYKVSGDARYRPYLLKSDRGRERVFAGDMGL